MKKHRTILKILSSAVNTVIVISMLLVLSYSGYSLWDNHQIISAAENVRADMLRLKPEPDETGKPDFSQLREINKDVVGWISVGGTSIDYPILQGEDNLSYITTDVYGRYSVAGSIFLDTRCSADFSDRYSLVYGHHMANGSMFGDLDRFKSRDFFYENLSGHSLTTADGVYELELACLLEIDAYSTLIFSPGDFGLEEIIEYSAENATFLSQSEKLKKYDPASVRLIALSTCSEDYADARTVLVFVICEKEESA